MAFHNNKHQSEMRKVAEALASCGGGGTGRQVVQRFVAPNLSRFRAS